MCGCCWIGPIYPWTLSCVDVAEIDTLVRDLSYTDRTTHGLHLNGQNGCWAAGGWSSPAKRWACEVDAELLLLHWPTNPTACSAVRLAHKPHSMFCSETGPQTPQHVLQWDWPTNPTACSAVRLAHKPHSRFCSETGPQTPQQVLQSCCLLLQDSTDTALATRSHALQRKIWSSKSWPGTDNQLHQYRQAKCLHQYTAKLDVCENNPGTLNKKEEEEERGGGGGCGTGRCQTCSRIRSLHFLECVGVAVAGGSNRPVYD